MWLWAFEFLEQVSKRNAIYKSGKRFAEGWFRDLHGRCGDDDEKMAGHMYENGKKIMETFFDSDAEKPLSANIVPEEKKTALGEANLEDASVFDELASDVTSALTKFISEKN